MCPECGQATIATRDSVVALVVGGNSMEKSHTVRSAMRTTMVPCCFAQAKQGVLWHWPLWSDDRGLLAASLSAAGKLCQIEGADSYMEIPCGLSKSAQLSRSCTGSPRRERTLVFCRHRWIDRRPLYAANQACAYVTYSDDLSKGWLLPTLHDVVLNSHRRMGCASQLLKGFFRPEERGYPRSRKVSGPSRKGKKPSHMQLPQKQSSGVDGEADEVDSQVLLAPMAFVARRLLRQNGHRATYFDDLILTMASIFSVQELRNIVLLHGGETMQHAVNKSKSCSSTCAVQMHSRRLRPTHRCGAFALVAARASPSELPRATAERPTLRWRERGVELIDGRIDVRLQQPMTAWTVCLSKE